ncbi:MAG: hypothetical protein IJ660_04495 [Alphaproteobacteria bacterium]|nr:hypothetical protein [Alphaproteobacteria bacterium]
MIKQIKYILYILVGFSWISSAQATLKMDASRSVGEILKSVTEQVGNTVDKAQKQLEHLKTYQKLVDGVKEGMAKIDEIKSEVEQVKSAVNDVKSSVNDAKKSAQGLKDAAGSATGIVGDAAGNVTDLTNSATGAVAGAAGTAANMANAQELVNLQTELTQLKTSFNQTVQDLQDARDREVKPYNDNIEKCEEIISNAEKNDGSDNSAVSYCKGIIADNQAKIKKIDATYEDDIEALTEEYEQNLNGPNGVMKKINELKDKALNMVGNVDDPFSLMNSGAVGNLFSGNAASAMNEVIAKNFYKKNEEDSVEGNKKLMAYRRGKFLDDAAEVYYQAVQQMSEDDKNIEYANSLQSNAQIVETTPAALMIDIPLKIENMKRLLKFARLLTAEMKMATSKDMINMPKKLNNYDKDVTAFNIDDYLYSDSKKGLLKKLEALKQQAAELKANEAAAKVGSTTASTVTATNIVSTTKSKFADIFRSVKTILYIISGFGLVGIAFLAIRGRISWGWFAGLAAGLAILAAAGAFIEYATGDNSVGEYFGDTATNAVGY